MKKLPPIKLHFGVAGSTIDNPHKLPDKSSTPNLNNKPISKIEPISKIDPITNIAPPKSTTDVPPAYQQIIANLQNQLRERDATIARLTQQLGTTTWPKNLETD